MPLKFPLLVFLPTHTYVLSEFVGKRRSEDFKRIVRTLGLYPPIVRLNKSSDK